MIQTLPPNRANYAFPVGSLPRRARRRKDFLDAHGFHILPKLSAENGVAVPKQVARDLLKRKSLPQLLQGPLGRRMGSDIEMHDPPTIVSEFILHFHSSRHAGTGVGKGFAHFLEALTP